MILGSVQYEKRAVHNRTQINIKTIHTALKCCFMHLAFILS
jgi:hypothetical protein